jgi:hypothetical protein
VQLTAPNTNEPWKLGVQRADEPLEKVTFDGSIADMAWLKAKVGQGRVAFTLRMLIKRYRRQCQEELQDEDTFEG